MQCSNCGATNRTDARHCKICGQALLAAQPAQPTQLVGYGALPFPAPAGGPHLLADDGRIYPLDQPLVVLGRDESCQVVIDDPRVSRRHAEIRQQGSNYLLADLGSSNGTFVNGQRLVSPVTLQPGERIDLGGFGLRFRAASVQIPMPGPQLPAPAGGPGPIPGSQAGPVPAASPHPLPAAPPRPGRQGGIGRPQVSGAVITTPREWQDQPPPDAARTMMLISVVLLFIGLLLAFIAFALTLGIVCICLGAAPLLFIIPLLLLPLQTTFSSILSWIKNDRPVTLVNFQMRDEGTGTPVDVHFVRKRGTGGGINLADKVEVWGRWKGGASIRATKLRVYETQAMSTSMWVPVHKPWPAWIGLLVLLIVLGGLGYLAYTSGIMEMIFSYSPR
jgi:hypothetical protein